MTKLTGANDFEKLKDLCTKTHKEQVIWFLNAFWEEGLDQHAELLWKWTDKYKGFDLQKGEAGNELDELNAHRFLEFFKETMTVTEMRDNLRSTGAIVGNMRAVPITHILIFRFKKDWHKLVNAPQGDNRAEIEEAQRLLDEVSKAFKEAEAAATAAKARLREAEAAEATAKAREAEAVASENAAKAREAEAKASEAEAKSREASAKASAEEAAARESEAKAKAADSAAREAEARAAQDELEAALSELKSQEDAFNNKTNELKAKGEDESIGLVTRNKAKAELAQHLSSDPLPLRRAKITQEAAVKKADKATSIAAEARAVSDAAAAAASKSRQHADADAKQATAARHAAEEAARQATEARHAAEQARHAAEASRRAAEDARHEAAQAKAAAEDAEEAAAQRLSEAEAYLEEVKAKPGVAQGAIWFMDRELHERRAYMPEKKGGYKKQH